MLHREAVGIAMGILAAFSTGDLGRTYFDAIAVDEREVDELEWRVNADRMEAAKRSKAGFGGL